MKKFTFGLVMALSTASTIAQTGSDIQANPTKSMYLQDGRGVIARNPYGLCWRTGYWTPADAVAGCDGELAPPIAKATAPAIAPATQPTPAPAAPKRCDFATTLSSDQTFAFNKAALSAPAKKRIDDEVLGKIAN